MPSSGLREQAGQIDQQNEKCQEKNKGRKKKKKSKEQRLQYWRVS